MNVVLIGMLTSISAPAKRGARNAQSAGRGMAMASDMEHVTLLARRQLAKAAFAIVALGASGSFARAQSHDHAGHSAAAPGKPVPSTFTPPPKLKPVVDAAKLCERRGRICRAHCIRMLKKGDASLAECLKLVEAMLPVCAATATLAAQDSKRFGDMAKICRDACTDCAAECRKHAAHHAECKACLEACEGMIKALEEASKA